MPDDEYSTYARLYSQLSLEKLAELDHIGLLLNSPEPAIICKQCGYAITADKDRVSRHLGEIHKVDKATRRGLNKLIRSLNLPDPKSLRLRPDGSAPHPHLKSLTGASSCRHCGLRSTSDVVLQSHLRETYPVEIELARKSGRHWLRDHIKTGLTLQSWTAQGVHKSWIIKIEGAQTSERQANANILLQETPDAIRDFAQQLFAEERQRLDLRPRGQDLLHGATQANLMTNWMRRTGWENLLQDARRDILIAMSDLPALTGRPFCLGVHAGESLFSSAAVEQQLASIMEATDRLFDRCGDTIRCTDVCVRRWLRGRFPDRPYKAPFDLVSKHSSERIYRKELKRCLCLWLRLLQLPHETTKSILGRGLRRSQRKELKRLGRILLGV
ncbi:uncharacterized protein BKA55DRAFT_529764 [Fusarium redolens]|uniref:Uncharacterized protein n=1 Tax=Fusarium redolens TaxID=48865 RepID=A0A9P9FVJ5_FUSRE|nr:uncharacterized protein BKA55DRAFT_529764 [Fusarium redolens]KAH7208485.1 hypothetical protein BKA55DRAFT_529764 [Fusarium redolens]